MKLTEATIKKSLPDLGQGELRDDQIKGLILRGNKNAASWSLRFTHEGERQRHTLGRWPGVNLTDARKAAQRIYGQIAVGQAPEKVARTLTLEEALTKAENEGFTHLSNPRNYFGTMRNHLGPLLKRDLRRITKADILAQSDKLRKTKQPTADLLLRVSKSVFRWLAERGFCENILEDLRVAQTNVRDEFLSVAEAKQVLGVCHQIPYPFGPAFAVLLLTAGRRQEVLAMRKSELDLESALWEIPGSRTKNGLAWRIPLSSPVVELLTEALELAPEGDWVFSTTGKRPSLGLDKALSALRTQTGLADLKLHDFRRSFATAMADLGFEPGSVDRYLNHVAAATNSRLSRIYNKSDMLVLRRRMADQWAEILSESEKA
ncbi:tyrosine-type recombinase/integrase [Ruegeria atlantica]|uniref:Tyrosine-type recombinase/integrase n=1 Tax=Ruegeria atlantica TaxID=81569 RepID=A0AA90YZS9_9RHOB|nr:site-specific integrase [Ruegeria atlantica]NOE18034.1 tyrosine-type recombinase/integrase [Ruegeria atlantica]